MKKIIITMMLFALIVNEVGAQPLLPWQATHGLENKIIFSFTSSGSTMFAGVGISILTSGSLYKSSDAGNNWNMIDLGMDPSAIFCMASKDNFVYAGTYEENLFLSSNNGQNWSNIQVNSVFGTGVFELGVSGNNIVCFTNTGTPLNISTNNGYNWTGVSTPLITSRANDFLNKGDLLFASTRKGIIMSTDHGFTWTRPNNTGLPANPDLTTPLSCLVSAGDRIYTCCIDKILYTTDNGNNWVATNITLGNFATVNTMVSHNNGLFASLNGVNDTTRGVIATSTGGNSWITINSGFPASTGVMCLMYYNFNLYAGTNGKGVYRVPLKIIDDITDPASNVNGFSLMQNYPNPFNPVTKINYELPIANYVSLKVYDALGNEVSTLVSEKQNTGSYSVKFNGNLLPSGIYFYKLEAGGFTDVKKMVLVK